MKFIILTLSTIAMTLSLLPINAGTEVTKKVICEKKFKIVHPKTNDEMGKFQTKTISKEKGAFLEVSEHLYFTSHKGVKYEYLTTVTYKNGLSITPVSAKAETKIDGKTCMTGSITFAEKTYSYKCTGHLTKKGVAIDPVQKIDKKDIPLPKGTIVFQSAAGSLANKFQQKTGVLKDISFIEFPDDIAAPELLQLKTNYNITREKPNEKGEYTVKCHRTNADKDFSVTKYNKKGELISLEFKNKFKMVEIKKE